MRIPLRRVEAEIDDDDAAGGEAGGGDRHGEALWDDGKERGLGGVVLSKRVADDEDRKPREDGDEVKDHEQGVDDVRPGCVIHRVVANAEEDVEDREREGAEPVQRIQRGAHAPP